MTQIRAFDRFFDEEELRAKHEVREFAEQLPRDVIERDHAGSFDRESWNACARFGILGLGVPEEYGGTGGDLVRAVLSMEGFGKGCRDNGLTFALNAQMWTTQLSILQFGSEAQKKRYLPALCGGEKIAAQAMTEPETGSDIYRLQARAERTEDGYVLNGSKVLVTLGPLADVFLIFATIDPAKGRWGLTAFLVDRDTPGLEVLPVQAKMGLRTVPLGGLELRDVRIPADARLGPEGGGVSLSATSLEWERSCMLAGKIGIMERQIDEAVAEAKRREQFGQPIGKFQAVSNRIADMKVRLEASRLLVYRVAALKLAGRPAPLEAAAAKLFLAESFVESSLDSIRIHGGRGYLTENEVERDLRDAVGGVLWGGTSDIQRVLVARLLGL
ncbi:MAG: acyl-CoA dehydrogenase family protein [bacterium]